MIQYRNDRAISAEQFIDVLKRSTLSERRPVHDPARIQRMLDHGNVLVTAWDGDLLVGVSRGLGDFAFCVYLSDLAVDVAYQKQGIGKELIRRTHEAAGPQTTHSPGRTESGKLLSAHWHGTDDGMFSDQENGVVL